LIYYPRNLPGGTEENHLKPQSSVYWPRFEPGTLKALSFEPTYRESVSVEELITDTFEVIFS
jgi:hypothetical protein